jgi:DNA repair protein RadC
MTTKKHYTGHRSRLKERLLTSKFGTLTDAEILEMLLYMVYPRRDTKPMAKEMLEQFGNLAKLLSLSSSELEQNKISPSLIAILKVIHEASCRLIKYDVIEKPILESWVALIDYCRASMGRSATEQFRVLYLNKKNMLINDELQDYGTIDKTSVFPREITKKALLLNATAVILVHNHPTGNTKPSKEDIFVTNQIAKSLTSIDVLLHDHVIVSAESYYSFKNHGLI